MAYKSPDGLITIDSNFARVGGKSYAINKINSVEIREYRQGGGCFGFLVIMVGLAAMLLMFEVMNKSGGVAIFFGLAMIFMFWLGFKLINNSTKVRYNLYLMTSSSETQALTSPDYETLEEIQGVIENAMAGLPV